MTNKQLRALMKRHNLSIQDISTLGMVSVATVRAWLRPKTSKAQRNMTKRSEALIRQVVTPGHNPSTQEPAAADQPSGVNPGSSA
jgi:hypothetical protein